MEEFSHRRLLAAISAEVANALWSLRRRGDISREDLAEAVDALRAAAACQGRLS